MGNIRPDRSEAEKAPRKAAQKAALSLSLYSSSSPPSRSTAFEETKQVRLRESCLEQGASGETKVNNTRAVALILLMKVLALTEELVTASST